MSRSDIATLLRSAARSMPSLPRSQFVGFLATLPGGKRVKRRKVHSWHKQPEKRARTPVAPRVAAQHRVATEPRQGRLL